MNETLKAWHDFYALVGTASATLIGLLFVAASVGSGVYTAEKHHALRAFLSPTIVHFSSVLAACLIVMMPLQSETVVGLLVGGDGLFGLVYAVSIWRGMIRNGLISQVDLEDRTWYAALPPFGHMTTVVASVALLVRPDAGCALLALAMAMLLLIGIRNAWDITVWAVMRHRD